jgi:Na+-transporting NADH:ubiquinone oxidoreductase subunit NqrC
MSELLWKKLNNQDFVAGLGALTGNQAVQEVDGISGGTITSVGVDAMLKSCLNSYLSFLTK